MPKLKHAKVIEKIMENNGNVSKAMRDVGYSPNYSKNPQTLVNTKSFQELMNELGLTETLLTSALIADIKSKKGKRVEELKLGFKIKGLLTEKIEQTGEMKVELVEVGSE